MVDYIELHDREGAPRIKGDGLLFVIDDVDYWTECSTVRLIQDDEPGHDWQGLQTQNVGRWLFEVSAIQSTKPGSLWRFLWSHEFSEADVIYAPHGNTEPSDDEPFFTGTVRTPSAPDLGGEAGEHTEHEFTVQMTLLSKPELVTTI